MMIDSHQIRPWTITWRSQTWSDDSVELNAADVCILQALVGDSWASVNPWASPAHLAAMIAVLWAKTSGIDATDALLLVGDTPAEEFIGSIRLREVLVPEKV